MTNEEKQALAQRREVLRKKIGRFFDTLYKEERAAVQSINLTWAEHLEDGKHDFYLLMDLDIDVKL